MSETKPSETQIEQRAYELFLERGCEHGRDIEDWLEAERELTELAELRTVETELAEEQSFAESEKPTRAKKQAAAAGVAAAVASST
ncbi:MAG TPA: DUF2934 domain-containing protein [Verrucomicrobiae bacterium]|nr:DUF2934 domain-containing protein [Verrucomicrobiae bacterium]